MCASSLDSWRLAVKCFLFSRVWVSLEHSFIRQENEGLCLFECTLCACVCVCLLTWWKDSNSKEGTSILGFSVSALHTVFAFTLYSSRSSIHWFWWFSVLWSKTAASIPPDTLMHPVFCMISRIIVYQLSHVTNLTHAWPSDELNVWRTHSDWAAATHTH